MLLSCENTLKNICNELQNVKWLFFLKKKILLEYSGNQVLYTYSLFAIKKLTKSHLAVFCNKMFTIGIFFYEDSYFIQVIQFFQKKNLNSRNFYYTLSFHQLLLGVTIDIMITSNEQSSTFFIGLFIQHNYQVCWLKITQNYVLYY